VEVLADRNVAVKKLERLSKVMKDMSNLHSKGGFVEAMKVPLLSLTLFLPSPSSSSHLLLFLLLPF
jgi:hypothetical protein